MKTRFLPLIALALGLTATGVRAQTNTPPVLIDKTVDIQVTDDTVGNSVQMLTNGSSFNGVAPAVSFKGGGGFGATAVANLDPSGNSVTSVTVTSGGVGYIGPPTITFSGGGATGVGAAIPVEPTATAFLNITQDFPTPNQNEAYGPAGDTIGMLALASGTQPIVGFTYNFTVNGLSIGRTASAVTPGQPAGIYWTPPLPGIYSIVSNTADDDGNTATSPPVRFFAEGTVIVSPEAGGVVAGNPIVAPGSIVPVGSTVVVQATSTSKDGFISRVDFYTDWTGSSGTLIGSATNYPYSVIYQPAGPAGSHHLIKAIGYDNTGTAVPPAVVLTNPNQDEILLTMAVPNVAGLPTATIITPSSTSLIEIPNYGADATSFIEVLVTAGAQGGAGINKVELYVNGVLYATDTVQPYTFKWTPQTTGSYALLALVYDTNGNVAPSSAITPTSTVPVAGPDTVIIEAAPAIAVTNPGSGATISAGAVTPVQAVAVDTNLDQNGNPIPITLVQFYQDGVFLASTTSPQSGDLYQVTFKPVQKIVDGVAVPSIITAIATDKQGFQGTSPGVSVTVNSGGGSSNPVIIGIPPTASVTAPLNNANVIVNSPVTISASGFASNGNIAEMDLFVDGQKIASLTKYPYSFSYTFQNLGTYQVTATATDNVGDTFTTPTATTVIVVPEPPPTTTITSPVSGGTVTTGGTVTITANAASVAGTIASVEFFENGLPISTVTMPPYTVSFTPLSAGIYTFTAIATDNAGETTMTLPVIVEAFPSTGGLGTTSYFGQYQGLTDGGEFAFITLDGNIGTFIGFSTSGSKPTIAFFPDEKVSPGGSFSGTALKGTVSLTGVSGNLIPSQDLFIGAATQSGSIAVAAGYYTGSIQGQAGSQLTGILGADGEFMLYVASGSFTDVGYGSVDSNGIFLITTANNNTLSGKVDPATGFLTGTISGPSSGNLIGSRVSGGTFSDGVLKNISTRGMVGSGANAMIAGFVVGGTAPKQLLVRAIGPTLETFNIPGAIAATQLQVFSGTTLTAANTGWSSTPVNTVAVTNANVQAGAFALPIGSGDSALVGTFAPGNYTAMVSGAGSATGVGLVEVYDLDTFTPFTSKKLTNVSTRGTVGTGNNVLIGGFVIDGTAPERLLIRGAGPSLTALNVSGALATPHLQLYNNSQTIIRENYTWGLGNDLAMVSAAEASTGAFAFPTGSADSVILIVLPPGTYTVELSGASGATGDALVEVYEVP
jgi:hypothetical protein